MGTHFLYEHKIPWSTAQPNLPNLPSCMLIAWKQLIVYQGTRECPKVHGKFPGNSTS